MKARCGSITASFGSIHSNDRSAAVGVYI
jgi:hypothetical protein